MKIIRVCLNGFLKNRNEEFYVDNKAKKHAHTYM